MQKTKGVFGFRPRQPRQIKGDPIFWRRNWPLMFSPSLGVKMNWARAWARGHAKPWLRSKRNASAWSMAKKLAGLPSDAIQTRPKCKRRGKDTGRLNEEKKAFKVALRLSLGFGNLSKLGESSSSELSKQVASGVSESVVSIASLIGDTVIYECTGIFIENSCADATSILTVASFVGTPEMAITDDLTIKVRLPNDRVVIGWLHNRYLNYDLAVVNIRHARGFQTVHLSPSHHVQFESNHKVVAVGRCFNSGMLKSTNGIVISSPTDGHSELMRATCKINQAWIGGPLVDFEGNFVGMNFRCGESTAFLPKNKILKCLGLLRNDAAVTVDNGALNRLFHESWPPPGGMTADVMNAVKKKFLDSIFQVE
ncbi:uncharacterized protein LOC133903621 [Phragmites australis]|uniref:uncharacterized protein LOC133903621 n=1 Tax=Phragmites australis TaxID=29695 RepID=UPI002D794F06|nr:uncharacterized protein LOC133903621 [Phragmites australis]